MNYTWINFTSTIINDEAVLEITLIPDHNMWDDWLWEEMLISALDDGIEVHITIGKKVF